MKTIKFCLLLICLSCLIGCEQVKVNDSWISLGDRFDHKVQLAASEVTNTNLAEIATPKIIRELNQNLEQFTPQVNIIAPQAAQILPETDINIELEVKDLPIFQDDKLKLGNHLDLILDNQPAQQIYDVEQPIILESLTPGTHSIRVFATRPWGESFKNEGAYAQTTFSVLTETNDNTFEDDVPLLTYSNPTGSYGAEPFLLDFYLTNTSFHSVGENAPNLKNWRVKATVNGESFLLDNWQAIYLTGLNPGNNWIQLELIDQAGNNIENNSFNNTVRVINYEPNKKDTLAKLVTGKISTQEALPIVEHRLYTQPIEIPDTIETLIDPDETKNENSENIEEENISEEIENTVELKTKLENKLSEQEQIDQIDKINLKKTSELENSLTSIQEKERNNGNQLEPNNQSKTTLPQEKEQEIVIEEKKIEKIIKPQTDDSSLMTEAE